MGLDKLLKIKDRLERLPLQLPILLEQVVKEISPIIEDLNIAQLQKGQRADESTLPNYSRVSVAKFGKPAGSIKLYDEGRFYKGITVEASFKGFKIEGKDSKTSMLQERYGDNILGLSAKSLQSVREDVLPSLLPKVKNYLHGY